jgi:hypothetical protein
VDELMKDLEDWLNKLIKIKEISRMLYVKKFFCDDNNIDEVMDLGISAEE